MKVSVREIEPSSFMSGFVRLSAEIKYDDGYPSEVLWFDIEDVYKNELSQSGNPWAVSLLPLAVKLGQNLHINKPCDYQLLQNLDEIMAVWNSWDEKLSRISIVSDITYELNLNNDRSAAFFSGGVDSFFTILKLEELAKNGKSKPLNDLLLVWGFDVPLQNNQEFLSLSNKLQDAAGKLNKNLIPVITNLKETRFSKASWGEHSHGAAIASIAYVLEKRVNEVFLASSYQYGHLVTPWGSHPLVDNLFSGSALKICLHGSPYNRVDKTELIARSNIALSALHVCWQDASHKNCGNCNKCYRTMITLHLAGKLQDCTTFEKKSIAIEDISRLYSSSEGAITFMEEVADFAYSKNEPEIAEAVLKSIRMSRRISKILSVINPLFRRRPFRRTACFVRNQIYKRVIK